MDISEHVQAAANEILKFRNEKKELFLAEHLDKVTTHTLCVLSESQIVEDLSGYVHTTTAVHYREHFALVPNERAEWLNKLESTTAMVYAILENQYPHKIIGTTFVV